MGNRIRALSRPASAATVGLALAAGLMVPLASGHGVLRREGGVLRYRAQDPGVGAILTVTSPEPRRLIFKDTTSPGGMDWGPCLPLSERRSRCPLGGVDHARVEVFDGPDVIRIRVALPTEVDSGDGPDRVTGGYGADTIQGGPDADVIDGGEGSDRLSGGPGDDTIRVRDGRRDVLTCGEGDDTVIADPGDEIPPLELPACEQVQRAAAGPDRKPPVIGVRAASGLDGRKLEIAVTMSEPGSFVARAKLRIAGGSARSLQAVRGRPDAPGQVWRVALGAPAGFSAPIRAALAHGRRVVAAIAVRGRDRGGNVGKRGLRVRLRG